MTDSKIIRVMRIVYWSELVMTFYWICVGIWIHLRNESVWLTIGSWTIAAFCLVSGFKIKKECQEFIRLVNLERTIDKIDN